MELKELTFDENGNIPPVECEIKEAKIFASFLVYSYIDNNYFIILEKRTEKPFKGLYELPSYEIGKFTINDCVNIFSDSFGIGEENLSQSKVFEYINAELKVRNIFIVFTGKIKDHTKVKIKTKKKIKFYNISSLPDMVFNHEEILNYYLEEENKDKPLP